MPCWNLENLDRERFQTELRRDQLFITFLWKPDGTRGSSIVIQKEVWLNISGKNPDVEPSTRYPVYHVYNYLDPSKAHSSMSGCRINPHEDPFLDLGKAIEVATQMRDEALASRKWVPVSQVRR